MGSTLITIGIIVLLLVIAFFVIIIVSGNKAKKNYKPPVPSEKTVLPDPPEVKLPARSREELRFCPRCGAANSERGGYCTSCGAKL